MLIAIISVAAVLVLFAVTFTLIVPAVNFQRMFTKKPFVPDTRSRQWKDFPALKVKAEEWLRTVRSERIETYGEPYRAHGKPIRLSALYIDGGFDRTVILVHGYRSCYITRLTNAEAYYKLGYNVLLPDNRAHGESDGKYISMGTKDSKDVIGWGKLMRERGAKRLIADGVSMGAATVLCIGNHEERKIFDAFVSDCSFTTLDEIIDWLFRGYGFLGKMGMPFFKRLFERRVGESVKENSPLSGVKNSDVPTLFLHGNEDRFVPFAMLSRLSEACNAPKRVVIVDGARHASSYLVDPELYYGEKERFIKDFIPND